MGQHTDSLLENRDINRYQFALESLCFTDAKEFRHGAECCPRQLDYRSRVSRSQSP